MPCRVSPLARADRQCVAPSQVVDRAAGRNRTLGPACSGSRQPFERDMHHGGRIVLRPPIGLARNDGNEGLWRDVSRLEATRRHTVQGFPAASQFVGTGFRRVVGFVQ